MIRFALAALALVALTSPATADRTCRGKTPCNTCKDCSKCKYCNSSKDHHCGRCFKPKPSKPAPKPTKKPSQN